jgi:hypothetical protein
MTQMELKPGLQDSVILMLPKRAQLYQLMVDQIPVDLAPRNLKAIASDATLVNQEFGQAYEVGLNATPWPQSIRAIYRVKTGNNRTGSLEAPRLFPDASVTQPIPVRTQLWSVYSQDGELTTKQAPLTNDEYDELLVGAFTELWTNSQVLIREKRAAKKAWLRRWANRMEAPLSRLRARATWNSGPKFEEISEVVLEYTDVFDPELFGVSPTRLNHLPTDLWSESQWLRGTVQRFATVGETTTDEATGLPQFKYTRGSDLRSGVTMRFIAAFVLTGLIIAVPRIPATGRVIDICRDYPHAALVVVGLAWWALLTPSWFGLVISLASALLWAAMYLRARRMTLRT